MLLHMLGKIIRNDDKVEDVNGLRISRNQMRVLNNYRIDIKDKDIKELLKRINDEQLYHVDSKGLPSDEHYDILESLYWDLKKQNKWH